eukprot:gene8519-1524_t
MGCEPSGPEAGPGRARVRHNRMPDQMLKKVGKELMGSADNAKVVTGDALRNVECHKYALVTDGPMWFALVSPRDEFVFTGKTMIHFDGITATTTKRRVKRYPYKFNKLSNVTLETAAVMDRDVELAFRIGSVNFAIDVVRKEIDLLEPAPTLTPVVVFIVVQAGPGLHAKARHSSSLPYLAHLELEHHVHCGVDAPYWCSNRARYKTLCVLENEMRINGTKLEFATRAVQQGSGLFRIQPDEKSSTTAVKE